MKRATHITPDDAKRIITETHIPALDQLDAYMLKHILEEIKNKPNDWFETICDIYTLGYHFGKASKKGM
ncbi:MAG: hypothetical protein IJ252_05000 [Solobacterium sp.]|nr:hypothetical protein [Solobacterium sp.]